MDPPRTEAELASIALALGARDVAGWSREEERRFGAIEPLTAGLAGTRRDVRAGLDPLGDAFCALRSREERRPSGATYTPREIVNAMVAWAARRCDAPARVVDPGVGSARFLVAAGRAFPRASLVGVNIDPLAAVVARGTLAAAGMAKRSQVLVEDYRALRLPAAAGPTLFLGNPPYVRHHGIDARWKAWLSATAARRGLAASQLAGLHVHFLLATLELAVPGDLCVFVTAAEWLDVNYGRLVRELFAGPMGGLALHLVEPAAAAFPDADTTAVIACCEVGRRPRTVAVRRAGSTAALGDLGAGTPVARERLESAPRWGPLFRPARFVPAGRVELGELCRVHRGQVSGANRVWIAGEHSRGLPPSVLFPTVTRARELFAAGEVLVDAAALRRVIDLPTDLDELPADERRAVERFLRVARAMGAHEGFVATHRRAWWSVALREPAPLLTTYMARRPLACVRNAAGARHLNIAHGLYPRVPMSPLALTNLMRHLNATVTVNEGRTYAGGLTKFEPREIERLLVPDLPVLEGEGSVVGAA